MLSKSYSNTHGCHVFNGSAKFKNIKSFTYVNVRMAV